MFQKKSSTEEPTTHAMDTDCGKKSEEYETTRPPVVQIDIQRRPGNWMFSIRDNGIGIKPEYVQRIFGIFKRLHGTAIRAIRLRS